MIERAVSIVIARCMKKRGMRWCSFNATIVVALRADVLNEDGDTPQQLRASPSLTRGLVQTPHTYPTDPSAAMSLAPSDWPHPEQSAPAI